MKFKLGRAQYKNKKIPSFAEVIDKTKNEMKYTIQHIFDNGIEKTIANSDLQLHVVKHRNNIGYINAAEVEMEELSADEKSHLEESENAETTIESSQANAVKAVQEILKNK